MRLRTMPPTVLIPGDQLQLDDGTFREVKAVEIIHRVHFKDQAEPAWIDYRLGARPKVRARGGEGGDEA